MPRRPPRPGARRRLRMLVDGVKRAWHQQLHAHEVYLDALQPWRQEQPCHKSLHWRRGRGGWRLYGDVVCPGKSLCHQRKRKLLS